ncbi:MAG: carboxypeptidase-like regulatory domain-containing protein [Cyclobacteriaceae bacterium]
MKKNNILIAIATVFVLSSATFALLKTKLQVTVIDKTGNTVEGASVTLYPTKADYFKKTNPVQDAKQTDKKGKVKFSDLEPTTYFMYAEKGDMDNVGSGIKADTLKAGKINKYNTVISDL